MKNFRPDYYFQFIYKKNFKLFFLAAGLFIFLASCSVKLYEPSPETVGLSTNLSNLKQGKKLYIENCASCHSLVQPEKHTAEKWVKLVNVMSKKAKINDEQASLILQYVTKGQKS